MAPSGLIEAKGASAQALANIRREILSMASKMPKITTRATEVVDEKPHTMSNMTIPIALGVTIPVVVLAAVLFYLHRRNIKKTRAEDAHDPHRDLDFGLDNVPGGDGLPKRGKKQRKSLLFGGGEKSAQHKINQLSMDMNLSSPYLLPPGKAHNSHDSLARGYQNEYDPYRIVESETASIRSKAPSTYGSSKHASVVTGHSVGMPKMPPVRQMSFPKPPSTPNEKDPFRTPTHSESNQQLSATAELEDSNLPIKPVIPEIDTVPYPDEKHDYNDAVMPDTHEPPPVIPRRASDRVASPARTHGRFELPELPESNTIGVAHAGHETSRSSPPAEMEPAGLGLNMGSPQPAAPIVRTPEDRNSRDSFYPDQQPQIQTSEYYEDYEDYTRGRPLSRQPAADYNDQGQGLSVPQQNNKRLSVGMRPLPPDEIHESEDPEYRANRIRSFYKEYFDDSKDPAPPMPAQQGNDPGYYEDYDQSYLGDIAYFDSESNAFVMPYAQPVTRRAMTPPPSGRFGGGGPRGPGPRGPPRGPRGPHGPHGSVGGMSMQGGRPRAGSSWGPRPGSSASARYGRPSPKRNLPPPSALNTLPTPSKLRDDSFALMNATDFAPPDRFSERAAGRSQSPLGERRAYQPKVPVASPLVTSFDDMAVLPSPHLLRKSSTFTGLDFAPPKKFKDSDTMSDAGSIRSNRSGMSASAMSAVRGGAGRVSRLPGDTVFTQQALSNQLKPNWDIGR